MIQVLNKTRREFSQLFSDSELSQSHLKPFMQSLYGGRQSFLGRLEALPRRVRELVSEFSYEEPEIVRLEASLLDRSHKFLLRLQDGKEIETVLIRERNRLTLCVSSQVGCAQACIFCHTGKMGLLRNLRTEEIVAQVVVVNRWLQEHKPYSEEVVSGELPPLVSNVVFMGMGEPLDNMGALLPALEILKDPFAFNLAPKRITVSTAGHLDGLKELIEADFGTSLALSLHAPTSSLREKIMPITRKSPVEEVLKVMEAYALKKGRKIFIQYTLFEGVNDTEEKASELIKLLHGRPFKVNLIPFNEVSFSRLRRPTDESVRNFQNALIQGGVRTTVRFSKGRDIQAACGQLVRK